MPGKAVVTALGVAIAIAGVVSALGGCDADSSATPTPSPDAGDSAPATGSEDVARFDACTCGDAPLDPAPGLGCSRERTISKRICIVDAACNVTPFVPPTSGAPAEVQTVKGAFAVVIELEEAIPADIEVAVNEPPIPPRETFRRGISLFAAQDWSIEKGPLSVEPANEAPAETRLASDRKKVVLVPANEMKGRWKVETVLSFDPYWGDDVCGEPERSSVGYSNRFDLSLE